MGNKYTVEAGNGKDLKIYHGTEWLVVALYKLWTIKMHGTPYIYWKRLTVR